MLNEIAREIEFDWKVINNSAAREALECMKRMGNITDPFDADLNGYSVVGCFLSHAKGWQGKSARQIKSELRKMCGHPNPEGVQNSVSVKFTNPERVFNILCQ